jgi:hypothetical protein
MTRAIPSKPALQQNAVVSTRQVLDVMNVCVVHDVRGPEAGTTDAADGRLQVRP